MSDEKPFALHITWTCYGTWLPGDDRGYVSDTLLEEGGFLPKQNIPGTPHTAPDPYTLERAQKLRMEPILLLTADLARVAADSMVDACARGGWRSGRIREG